MATSSIFHDFVINDEESAERLADILTSPKPEPRKPTCNIIRLTTKEVEDIFLKEETHVR